MRRRALLLLAAAAVLAGGARAKTCKTVVDEDCDPCFMAGSGEHCENWKKQCSNNVCQTLCLRETWKFKATGSGPAARLSDKKIELAFNAQFLADACVNVLECCPDEDLIKNWAAQRTFGGYDPTPLLPIKECQGEDRAKACSSCKVAVEMVSTKEKCDAKYLEHPDVGGSLNAVFSRALTPAPPEVPKHTNFRVKCQDVADAAQAKFGAIKARIEEKACQCLGCCDPPEGEDACPFSVAFASVADAIKRLEKDA